MKITVSYNDGKTFDEAYPGKKIRIYRSTLDRKTTLHISCDGHTLCYPNVKDVDTILITQD